MTSKQKTTLFNILGALGVILTIYAGWWAYQKGLLTDQAKMEAFMKPFGVMGILLFVIIQVVQTVIPIIPGAITSIAGVAMYGLFWGTVWNYFGIVIGCYLLFLIVRKYGKPFVEVLVNEKTYEKYIAWLDRGDGFEKFFIVAMVVPFMPADFICAIAALTKMPLRRYMTIIALTKPISILTYTVGATKIIEFFYKLIVH